MVENMAVGASESGTLGQEYDRDFVAVVATKDRKAHVTQLLHNLFSQSVRPVAVCVVDSSRERFAVEGDVPWAPDWVRVIWHTPPSAAAQRNRGIFEAATVTALVVLLDDDITLEPDALFRMREFWLSQVSRGVVAAGFNQVNAGAGACKGWLKYSRLAQWLGLYDRRPGAVSPSGWHTVIGTVDDVVDVDWLPSGAAVWRSEVLGELGGFDEFFTGYSYLEDLELSWRARSLGRLVVVGDARCEHGHATAGKVSAFEFGRIEVRNRLYFVRKHGLSLPRCVLGLVIRGLLTLGGAGIERNFGLFLRFLGNLRGAADSLSRRSV